MIFSSPPKVSDICAERFGTHLCKERAGHSHTEAHRCICGATAGGSGRVVEVEVYHPAHKVYGREGR